jgi:hypothetical protein
MRLLLKQILGAFGAMLLVGCTTAHPRATIKIDNPKTGANVYSTSVHLSPYGETLSDGEDFSNIILYTKPQVPYYDTVEFSWEGYRSEVDLYAEDPRAILDLWHRDAFGSATKAALQTPAISTPYILINPTVAPFSPPPGPRPVKIGIFPEFFYPWLSDTSRVPPLLKLNQAVFYNHGRCATETPLKYNLQTIVEGVADSLVDRARGRTSNVWATTFVDFGELQMGGGFLLYLSGKFKVEVGINYDVEFEISRQYHYYLDDGVLRLRVTGKQDDVSRFRCLGPIKGPICDAAARGVHDGVLSGLDSKFIEQFNQVALDQQSQSILDEECDATVPGGDTCSKGVNAAFLRSKATSGVEDVAAVFSMTAAEKGAFKANVTKQVPDPRNWRCAAAPSPRDPNRGLCKFILRAERLNVFPDALQLIWMTDDSRWANSAAAVVSAAYSGRSAPIDPRRPVPLPDTSLVTQLCTAQHSLFSGPPFATTRSFLNANATSP